MIDHIDVPYQFDLTHLAPTVNLLLDKMRELAKDQFVSLHPNEYYTAIDYVKITEVFNIIATAQRELCIQLGVPTDLAPLEYYSVDYGNIIGCMVQLGDSLNNIIDATQNMIQSEAHYE